MLARLGIQDIHQLEHVQKFTLRMCTKQWDLGYAELLNHFKVPSLGDCRNYLSLCTMYKVVNELVYFPHDVFVPWTTTLRSSCKFLHSFVPKTCSAWNNLPDYITHANILCLYI